MRELIEIRIDVRLCLGRIKPLKWIMKMRMTIRMSIDIIKRMNMRINIQMEMEMGMGMILDIGGVYLACFRMTILCRFARQWENHKNKINNCRKPDHNTRNNHLSP